MEEIKQEIQTLRQELQTATNRLSVLSIIVLVLVGVVAYNQMQHPAALTGQATAGLAANNTDTADNVAADSDQPSASQPTNAELIGDYPSMGSKSAKVVIALFSDYQCPYCKKGSDVVKQIRSAYGDKVLIVARDFPLTQIHSNALKAAEAANCAFEQGKFWEYHDKLFDNQANLGVERLKQYAKDLKLDTAKFNDCLDTDKYENKVLQDQQAGIEFGVQGTPSFFIGGEMIPGAAPFDTFKEIIDEKLGE